MRLEFSLIINTTGKNWDIFIFLHGVNHQLKVESEATTSSYAWPVLALAQANCRNLWSSVCCENVIWYLIFLHGDSRQGKIASETSNSWAGMLKWLQQGDKAWYVFLYIKNSCSLMRGIWLSKSIFHGFWSVF